MKKVLLITYMFPPIAGSGIQRTLKFIKYLPNYDIIPIVFSPRKAVWKAYDYKNLDLPYVKNTKVYRYGIKKLEHYYNLRFKKRYKQHPYYYYLGLKYIWFMDLFSSWYFECNDKALKIAEKEKVDCIFTTSPPHSVHLFGKFIKLKIGIPWVMDLRDAMYDNPNRDFSKISDRLQSNVERYYEKTFYQESDAIITVSQPIHDSISVRHPYYDLSKKSYLITNGYDDDDYINSTSYFQQAGKLVITYTGAFLLRHTPEKFLKGLASLIVKNRIDPNDLLIRFIGYFNEKTIDIFKKYSEFMPIRVIDFQPYDKTIAYQVSSDLLLLIVSIDEEKGGNQIFTGKFFEYLGAQKPIFALAPNGPLKDTIETGRFGIVSPPNDINAIAENFKKIYDQWKKKEALPYNPDKKIREKFTRRNLTKNLANIIKQLTQ